MVLTTGGHRRPPAAPRAVHYVVDLYSIALFWIVAGGLTLLLAPRDSAEFVVLILTIGIGVAMLVVVALLSRMGGAPRWAWRPKRDSEDDNAALETTDKTTDAP